MYSLLGKYKIRNPNWILQNIKTVLQFLQFRYSNQYHKSLVVLAVQAFLKSASKIYFLLNL